MIAIRQKYPHAKLDPYSFKNHILIFLEQNIKDPDFLLVIEECVERIMSCNQKKYDFLNKNESKNFYPSCLLCKKQKKKKEKDPNVPAGIIIGGVEVLCGALLSIPPPTRGIGSGLMIDGVRRALNDCQEKEKEPAQS